MLLDRATIYVKAGDGGSGAATFRREKYVPRGGPDGGDGGRGGSVYVVANETVETLLDLQQRRHFKAQGGGHGARKKKHGAAGADVEVPVALGTEVWDADGTFLGDLTAVGQRLLVARGGRGGLGNTHFATATRQAPTMALKGEPGEERWLRLELKLIADVGIIGLPNAGKSTLLAAVSEARPKIAEYAFTTLAPNLGVATIGEGRVVFADIPGLVGGASGGAGLGHEFLRHIERTRLLVHVVDGSVEDPLAALDAVNHELASFSAAVAEKPQIVAMNKLDRPEARERLPMMLSALARRGVETYGISALTGEGVAALLEATARLLTALPAAGETREPVVRPVAAEPVSVAREGGAFRVRSSQAERIAAMTDLENDEGVAYLERQLGRLGVLEALERAGVRPGDLVRVGKVELLWGEETAPRRRR